MSDFFEALRDQQIKALILFVSGVIIDSIGASITLNDIAIDGLESVVLGAIDDSIDDITGVIESTNQDVITAVNKKTDLVNAAQTIIIRGIGTALAANDNQILSAISNVRDDSNTSLDAIIGGIGGIIDSISDNLSVTVQNQIDIDGSLVTDLTDQMVRLADDSIEQNKSAITIFKGIITDFLDDAIRRFETGADATTKGAIEIVKAILTNAGEITVVKDVMEAVAKGDFIPSQLEQIFKSLNVGVKVASENFIGSFRRFLDLDFESIGLLCDPLPENNEWVPDNPWANAVINGLMLILQASIVPLALATQRGQICLQVDSLKIPWNIISPGDAVEALHRGLIDRDTALDQVQKAGFSKAQSETLIDTGDTIPQIEFLFSMWFREIIRDDAIDLELKSLGFTKPRIDALKQIAFFIPPVQDLITMAVREVFSPEIALAQGQFEDFPSDFGKWAKQQGVTEAWALNYWAAHWALPSPQMGFEMLHRGVIDEPRLKNLLRALDVMPGWRDEMVAISFTPFTRVDIRRMHALGVLSDERVEKAYLDIGYSPDNAKLQLQFVKELNKTESIVTLDIASDLTRGNIITFYTRGIIPRALAVGLLIQAGINVAAAALFIENADFTLELRERRDEIDIVFDRFKVEETTFTGASDELNRIDLQPLERKQAQLDLERLRLAKVKTPSKADLDKFLKAGIVDRVEYVDQLQLQGYSPLWADRFLQLNTGVA